MGDVTQVEHQQMLEQNRSTYSAVPGNEVKNSVLWKDKYEEVRAILKSYNLFYDEIIDDTMSFYFNKLGFTACHFEEISSKIISKIIVCIITAKINQKFCSDTYFPIFEEKQDNIIFIISRVFAQDNKTRLNYKMERKIEKKYFHFSDMSKDCYRLKSFRSVHSVFDEGETKEYEEPLRTYILELPTYENEQITNYETNLKKLMDINFYNSIKNTENEKICYELNKAVLNDLTSQFIQIHYTETSDTTFTLILCAKRSNVISEFFSLVGDCLNMHKCFSSSKYVEPLKNDVLILILNVVLGTYYQLPRVDEVETEQTKCEKKRKLNKTINQIVTSLKTLCLFHNPQFIHLTVKRIFTTQESAYIYLVMKFITFFSTSSYSSYKNVENALNIKGNTNNSIVSDFYIIKEQLKSSKYTESEIFKCVQSNIKTIKLLFKNFEKKFNKSYKINEDTLKRSENEMSNGECAKSSLEIINEIEDNKHKKILKYFYTFENYIEKTNFFLTHKISFAVAFKGTLLKESIYEAVPHSIIMILGPLFVGFHIRFTKISRGGVRIVISNNINSYTHNYENLFDEAYNLSLTQNFKNKDIPEGGSKGIILLKEDACNKPNTKYIKNLCFYSYVNSLLDLLMYEQEHDDMKKQNYNINNSSLITDKNCLNDQIKLKLKEENDEDLIFLGPDENTGCDNLMDWGALLARKRNYKYWKTFTTGKLRKNGGVPHDYYGMTTLGIETYIKKLCEKLNIKEENIYRSLVGGPDGDLGSNCILQSKTKFISVIDGSGVLYDKKGLNKEELIRLANIRKCGTLSQKKKKKNTNETSKINETFTCCTMYNEKYLSDEGFKISTEQSNVNIFGKVIRNGLEFRNNFFLNELNKCELFNPCGGRPNSINIFNVNSIINNDKCIYKYIVEGANVFISDDARAILEKKGVILFKDASTNKGGVISSSLEVLAGLVLENEQYLQLMCSTDTDMNMEEEGTIIRIKIDGSIDNNINTVINETEQNIHIKKKYEESEDSQNKLSSFLEKKEETEETEETELTEIKNDDVTPFYKAYVEEIQQKIKHYCELEFEALWNEARRTGTSICEATNILSKKISELKRDIINSNTLCFDYRLVKTVTEDVIPSVLLKIVSFDEIFKRVPFSYLKSLFASALASKYYYSQQFLNDLSVFNFYEFIKNLQKE